MNDFRSSPAVMGIINVTPDSFSGDGLLLHKDFVAQALGQAAQMVSDGASILDIGGESSRPGSVRITTDEEIRRVVPVIRAIRDAFPHLALSIDTTKADVADEAISAGATMINDISALHGDKEMKVIAARRKADLVLMHNKTASGEVTVDAQRGSSFKAPLYEDVVSEVSQSLRQDAEVALKAGVERTKIVLDPGIGFGKTVQQNLLLIAHLSSLIELGYPVMMGVSRKSFIGRALDLPLGERLEGTAACVTASILNGAQIVRVHDVRFMSRIVKMAAALKDA